MNKERIDDLVDILANKYEEIENAFVIRNKMQLLKYIENPEEWRNNQIQNNPRYRKSIIKDGKQIIKTLSDMTEKVVLMSYQEIDPNKIKITESEIKAAVPNSLREKIKSIKEDTINNVAKLCNATINEHVKDIQIIAGLKTTDDLYDTIKKYTIQGIDKAPVITYSDGKNMSFKSYMEMKTRTTIQSEISQQQIEAGTDVGQIFYYCDSFSDCAPDHADYQDRYYYNSNVNIPSDVQYYIDANNILSMQEVRDAEPWLTTRPNCRHAFHAVPIDEVMGDSFKKERYQHGKYDDEKYNQTQELRAAERKIRKYKLQESNANKLYNETKDENIKNKLDAIKYKLNAADKNASSIAKEYHLKRDKSRESNKVIQSDIGVKYDLKIEP